MRFFGHGKVRQHAATAASGFFFLLAAATLPPAFGQTAPYVLPYTMSTYAGPHAALTIGASCGSFLNQTYVALDTAGDGCTASNVSVGSDPHDVRLDGASNLYWIDNTTGGVVHKIDPFNQLETIYAGSLIDTKVCATETTKYGDNCQSTDGVANNTSTYYTTEFKGPRGIGVASNGDLLIAGYNDEYDHYITADADFMSLITGSGTAGYQNGAAASGLVDESRGIDIDASGNVYIADSGNNILREVTGLTQTNGVESNTAATISSITATNSAKTLSVTSDVPASSALLAGPEDVQLDASGNIYIADLANDVVRAIYAGGTLPGISNPVVGNIYTIAGNGSQPPYTTSCYSSAPTTPPPVGTYNSALTLSNGVSSTVPATSVALQVRKLSIDARGNLYLADSCNGVVWFVDAATGNMRVLAGLYGQTQSTTPSASLLCSNPANAVGDGCPGPQSSLDPDSDMGVSADSMGNIYITDAEGGSVSLSRIRKLLSGLNFPASATGAALTQNILLHFAAGDSPASASAYAITAQGSGATGATADYAAGAATCTTQADGTDDCLLPITFTPSVPGYDIATLTVTSAKGGIGKFLLTGTGTAAAIAFDPGDIAQLTATANGTAVGNSQGIALDGAGNAYIADTANNRVLFYNAATQATTVFAGGGTACGAATDSFGDGCPATAATLKGPKAVAIDTTGSVYIADTGNNLIRKVAANGVITVYGGGASSVCSRANDARGDGCPAAQATFSSPSGLTADNLGNLYVADTGNNVIRQIASNSNVTTLAGGGTPCSTETDSVGDGCPASATTFAAPTGLAFDVTGKTIVVADTGDNRIRRIGLTTTFTVTAPSAVSNILIDPVTLVAGTGSSGTSLDANNNATLSELDAPTGVAVGAGGTVYIADTGNNSIRMVSTSGVITTIAGITSAAGGDGAAGGAATSTQLSSPAAVAVTPLGTLFIADSGNSRILTDSRSQIAYSFGRINSGTASPIQNFTELNIGTSSATLTAFTQAPVNSQFTLTPAATSNSSIPACATGAAAAGAICNLQAQFTPTSTTTESVTYTETGTSAAGVTPSIALSGTGAVLTPTTSTVMQSSPVLPTASQYGASLTLSTTVTPASCNTVAPACYPTGTVTFVVDGVDTAPVTLTGATTSATASTPVSGLSVGSHTVSCNYSGDSFYAPSTCASVQVTVTQASTTSTLKVSANNQVQFTSITLTASVVSNTIGVPSTGTVTFYASGTMIGTTAPPVNASGVASLLLQVTTDATGAVTFNNTLPPGTYTLTCTYSGASDFAASNCAGVSFTVTAQPQALTLTPRGCVPSSLYPPGSSTASLAETCPYAESVNGSPEVAVAQGSTTDATIFITPTNTVSGVFTFSCSGLPADSTCTFSPTSLAFTAGTAYATPQYVDVTLWNDLQPGSVPGVSALHAPTFSSGHNRVAMAGIVGWPLTLLGFLLLLYRRRKTANLRGLSLLAVLMVLGGSGLTLTGCTGGPGAYKAVLTPPGTYPIVVTVTGGSISQSTTIMYTVTSPGIAGQE